MAQTQLFDDLSNENEDDLIQQSDSFDQAVIWGTDWTTETITNQLFKENIDLDPKFQRRDAWTSQAKSKFIESLILGLPIPQIILAEKKDAKGKYIVIDGKQRLLTIRKFFAEGANDEFKPLKLTGLSILNQLNGKTNADLMNNPRFSQIIDQLQNQTIRTTVIKNWPNESFLFTVFLRLNTGSIKLSPQELRQALHPGNFIDFADNFSIESDAIKTMLNLNAPDFRMRDVEIVIRYYNFKLFLNQYDGNLKTAFDRTVQTLNKEWNTLQKTIIIEAQNLEKAISFTIDIFGKKEAFSKWTEKGFQGNFNRAIFDIMVFYFSNDKILRSSSDKGQQIVNTFKTLSGTDNSFLSSLEQTTKSLANTEKRLRTWGEALAQLLSFKIQVPYLENNRLILRNSENG
ncbi:MAG: hypothetical protein COW65_15010 [Cytophagales bacterium CG18_big_fil_WC_8_21_14_2_50_42_9]|nr:MAG: hypothetical protein COW65_15010 [Cytophagales bacterium CG18_big_fil_WC_8_21_14_2_50_42_9]